MGAGMMPGSGGGGDSGATSPNGAPADTAGPGTAGCPMCGKDMQGPGGVCMDPEKLQQGSDSMHKAFGN